ncbi:putative bifunctional diguanylate cyclase/phosphodiesterase [Bradyrhizobium archetypum]|uniref:EAL domain-containing protein n=1 Tax=Bradyrhizobium archetypum TaxID=2721160 RepID=A0A7Y4M526_9BRAD|nr:EAL domain-containing protein [Bradyrhizobium archetypum]NOJ50114.1 EAL domain-containing protein [Bradyrhizobium archetypum]
MLNLRPIKILLALVTGVFVAATAYISALVMERQSALERVSRYNVAWLVGQATSEYTRLEQRVSAFGLPDSKISADEVRLRFDIIVNRLSLLRTGEVEEFVKADAEYAATIDALARAIDAVQPYLEDLKPAHVPRLLQILLPVDARLAQLAAAANRVGGDRVADDQRQLIRLHWTFSVMAAGLIVCGIALIVLLAWHNRLLQRAHNEMKVLTNDLRVTSENLAEAHQEVQFANAELERQNETLVRRDRDLRTQNERFEAALGNMSQALCLVDAQQRLVICNQRYQAMFGFDKNLLKAGTPMRHLAEFLSASSDEGASLYQVYANQQILVRENRARTYFEQLNDGRTVGVSHQPLSEGGWVATYEDLTERRRAEARIAHMAHHDALTDLPNRTLFHERMIAALERAEDDGGFAVMLLDLDRFKTVNDTLGHPVGDALLKSVAERLSATVRPGDLVARLGGDEFAVLAMDASNHDVSQFADRILRAIAEPFETGGHHINIGTSIGVALALADGHAPDELLKNADLALYQAKAAGRATFCFFKAEMNLEVQARRQIELDLRVALAEGEFHLLYQPQVNLTSGRITGCEALLRWNHPVRGPVPPSEFIPIAEEAGLIPAIGDWALRRACHEAAGWRSDVKIAVNMSPAQFKNPNLPHNVVLALAASGLPAERLELEITESLLLQDNDTTMATLHRMRELGVGIALDDFGTGYSSLSYLRRFPFDKIKIDQTFVREMTTDADCMSIIQSVIDLAHTLRMKTTGEGVETMQQKDSLQVAGCTDAQGFYFFRPMSGKQIADLLAAGANRETAA